MNKNHNSEGTILLVDDDRILLDIGQKMLKKISFEVIVASSCNEAQAILREHTDLITCAIIDMTMPDIDGQETFNRLKKINPNIRTIISSGYPEDQIVDRFSDTLPDGFIQKPFQLNELLSKLLEVMHKSHTS